MLCTSGQSCCDSTRISNVTTIIINGDSVMSDSVIKSNGNDIELLINGSSNKNNNLYCNSSDSCYIYCQSITSCEYLDIYCFGQCFVDCSGPSYYCPSVEYGTYSNWNASTVTATSEEPIQNTKNSGNGSNDVVIIIVVLIALVLVITVVVYFIWKRECSANANGQVNVKQADRNCARLGDGGADRDDRDDKDDRDNGGDDPDINISGSSYEIQDQNSENEYQSQKGENVDVAKDDNENDGAKQNVDDENRKFVNGEADRKSNGDNLNHEKGIKKFKLSKEKSPVSRRSSLLQ